MAIPAVRRLPTLPIALLAVFLTLSALLRLDRARRPIEGLDASVEGQVAEFGDVPGGAHGALGFRYWSTWNGSDDHQGRLILGPFVPPARFGLLVRGYPGIGGNTLAIENTRTGETLSLVSDSNPGESWAALQVEIPVTWKGAEVRIDVHDRATEWGGWMAISEPFITPWWAAWWRGILPRLAAFLLTGLSLATLVLVAHAWVLRLRLNSDAIAWLLAIGVVAALGYSIFWLHFWRAAIGIASVWTVFGAALVALAWHARDAGPATRRDRSDTWVPPLLMLALGLFAFAALHLYTVDGRQSRIAAARFGSLPADNEIPQVFAERLIEDRSPRALFGDWLSSDRPPLQTGWQLVIGRPALAVGVEFDTAMQCAAIWFQLAWIPAVWAWLRHMRLAPGVVALAIAALAPGTFLLLNTIFVWPKLAAGALMLGAFMCWYFPASGSPIRLRHHAVGGALAALAWLAHGGVAFALLPLVPWIVVRLRRDGLPRWFLAAAVFAVFALPWTAYQKFYDPPGNRLLKWHLGGHIPPDDRGTWETLRAAYGSTPMRELVAARRQNFNTILAGEWRSLVTFTNTDVERRRSAESGCTFFAFGPWNLGFAALALTAVVPAWRRRSSPLEWHGAALALAWAGATTLVWMLLMFIPGSTLIHQGSYTTLLVLLPTLALALWRVHPAAFFAVSVAHLASFVQVTLPPSPASDPLPWRTDATVTMLLAALGTALIVFAARSAPHEDAADVTCDPKAV